MPTRVKAVTNNVRKTIKGYVYNTKESRFVAECRNGYRCGEPAWCCETLYRNIDGAYFLHGEGGAKSRYSRNVNGESVASETIILLSESQAREWAEISLSADEYEALFGVAEESSEGKIDREQVQLRLACETIALLRKLSKETDVPVACLVDKAVMKLYGD
jgi:hypothetical protein